MNPLVPLTALFSLLFFGAGLFVWTACHRNWNFFFEDRKARLVVALLDREGARVFYQMVSVLLFVVATVMLVACIDNGLRGVRPCSLFSNGLRGVRSGIHEYDWLTNRANQI